MFRIGIAGVVMCLILGCAAVSSAQNTIAIQGVSYPAEYAREGTAYLVKESAIPLSFFFEGDKAQVGSPRLVLEMPACINVVYAYQPNYWTNPPVELKIDSVAANRGYRRYTIPLDPKLVKKGLPKKAFVFDPTHAQILLEASKDAPSHLTMQWWLEDGGISGVKKTIDINVLPAFAPVDAKGFDFQINLYTNNLKAPSADARQKMISLYNNMGVSGYLFLKNYADMNTEKQFSHYSECSSGGWGNGWWGISTADICSDLHLKPEDVLIVLKSGNKPAGKNAICQTWLIENRDYYLSKLTGQLKKFYTKGITSGFVNDYEIDIFSDLAWQNSCFCPRCRSAFAAWAKLDPGKISSLTPDEILSTYKSQWMNFRYWQNGQMMRLYNEAVKSLSPELRTIICSITVPEDRILQYHPIDPREYDEYVDEHWPMIYVQSPLFYKQMSLNTRYLKKPVLPCVGTCYPVGEYFTCPASVVLLHTIATASLGGRGVVIFGGIDGEYASALNRACSILSRVGDFYRKGTPADSAVELELQPLKVRTAKGKKYVFPDQAGTVFSNSHRLGDRTLVTIFNYDMETQAFAKAGISGMPAGKYRVTDAQDGLMYTKSKSNPWWTERDLAGGILCKIPAQDVKLLVIEEWKADGQRYGASAESVQRELIALQGSKTHPNPPAPLFTGSNNLELHNAVRVPGILGSGLRFNGRNSWAEVTDRSVSEAVKDAYTLELWVCPEEFPAGRNMNLVAKRGSFNLGWYEPLNVLPLDIIHNNSRYFMNAANPLKAGKWTYLVCTYGHGYLRMYANGRRIEELYVGRRSIDDSKKPIVISSNGNSFNGIVDGLNIYKEDLSAEAVWLRYMNYLALLDGKDIAD